MARAYVDHQEADTPVPVSEHSGLVQIIRDSRGGRMEVPPGSISQGAARYTFDWYLAPHSPAPPLHYHPRQEEAFEVISGQFTVTLGTTKHVLNPGDILVVPTGWMHAVANKSDRETRVRTTFTPALETHRFFELFFAIERSSRGLRRIARWSVLFRQMPGYIAFRGPLRLVGTVLDSITRLLGYRLPDGA
jgi:mannose-6-phosphate isomerase-like protein (cupin superfamily)